MITRRPDASEIASCIRQLGEGRTVAVSAARKSPFVRRQLERSEMTAEQAASDPEAWARLAFVTKDDLMEDQRLAPPFGTRRTVPIEDIAMVVEFERDDGHGQGSPLHHP